MPQLLDKELFQDQRASSHSLRYQLWLHMFNALLFVVGGILFTIGSLLFYEKYDQPTAGASCFLIGSISFFSGATQDLIELRCAVNAPPAKDRLLQASDRFSEDSPINSSSGSHRGHATPWCRWLFEHSVATRQTIVAMYMAADFMFCLGSLYFFPSFSEHLSIGLWLFIIGSIVYVMGMAWDVFWIGAHRHLRNHYTNRELLVARVLNTINLGCYTAGCIIFVPGRLAVLWP